MKNHLQKWTVKPGCLSGAKKKSCLQIMQVNFGLHGRGLDIHLSLPCLSLVLPWSCGHLGLLELAKDPEHSMSLVQCSDRTWCRRSIPLCTEESLRTNICREV